MLTVVLFLIKDGFPPSRERHNRFCRVRLMGGNMSNYIYIAIGLFVLAAFMGLIVLIEILSDRPTPKPAVFAHGTFAVVALLLLLFVVVKQHGGGPVISLSILVLAALGGLTLFTIDMQKKPIPKWLALVHPFAAVIGLIALVAYALF